MKENVFYNHDTAVRHGLAIFGIDICNAEKFVLFLFTSREDCDFIVSCKEVLDLNGATDCWYFFIIN